MARLPSPEKGKLGEPGARLRRVSWDEHAEREESRYADALARLASLRGSVDAFFDHVLVMAADVRVRANRLALLAALSRLFLHMANLSRLPG